MRFHLLIVFLELLLVLGPGAGRLRAEDVTTRDGTVFKNATAVRFEAEGVVFRHDGGTNRVEWKDLAPATRDRYQAEARRQKEQEIQKLKQDLARAEAEAARLNQANPAGGRPGAERPPPADKPKTSSGPGRGPEAAPASPAPVSPLADLPPVKPDEVIDAVELVQQFKNDPAGADRRYRKKKFRVRGVVDRFEPVMFVRKYDVLLESPDRWVRVVASFDYPTDYRSVYAVQRGAVLVGKPAENKEVTLLKAGQTIVLQGTCKGARDAGVVMTGCELVR